MVWLKALMFLLPQASSGSSFTRQRPSPNLTCTQGPLVASSGQAPSLPTVYQHCAMPASTVTAVGACLPQPCITIISIGFHSF